MVLLRNDGVLPLKTGINIAIVGPFGNDSAECVRVGSLAGGRPPLARRDGNQHSCPSCCFTTRPSLHAFVVFTAGAALQETTTSGSVPQLRRTFPACRRCCKVCALFFPSTPPRPTPPHPAPPRPTPPHPAPPPRPCYHPGSRGDRGATVIYKPFGHRCAGARVWLHAAFTQYNTGGDVSFVAGCEVVSMNNVNIAAAVAAAKAADVVVLALGINGTTARTRSEGGRQCSSLRRKTHRMRGWPPLCPPPPLPSGETQGGRRGTAAHATLRQCDAASCRCVPVMFR
jgi:hypothetical protein